MAAKKKPSQGIAVAALLLNILVIPGLGTIVGGRTGSGVTQLVLSIVSFILIFTLIGAIIGIPLLLGMWIWGLVTGIQLIKEAE